MCQFGFWGERKKENGASSQGGCWYSATELQTPTEGLWEVAAVTCMTSGYATALTLYLISLLESQHKEQSTDSAAPLQSPEYLYKASITRGLRWYATLQGTADEIQTQPLSLTFLHRRAERTPHLDMTQSSAAVCKAARVSDSFSRCYCQHSCKAVVRTHCTDPPGIAQTWEVRCFICYITKAFSCVHSFTTVLLYRIIVEDEKYCYF